MLEMHANNREEIKLARAGDIVALCGLKVRINEGVIALCHSEQLSTLDGLFLSAFLLTGSS